MAIKTICPSCRASFTLADEMRGKKVRCKKCEEPFVVRAADDEDDIPEVKPARDNRLAERPRPAAAASSKMRRADPDDDDRPKRSVKKPAGKAPSGGMPVGLIIGGVAILLVLVLGGGGLAAWFLLSRSPAADNAAAQDQQAFAGDLGQGRMNPPNGGVGAVGAKSNLRYRWDGGPHVYAVRVEAEKDDHFEVHEGNCVINVRKNNPQPAAPQDRKGTGTGFVVNANGYLVTCAHVVADATKIDVALGGQVYGGTVVAIDHDVDVAVVQVNARNLPTLSLVDSDRAEVGMEVRALGFPLSSVLGDNLKATRGTLSGVNNQDGRKVFQIDAPINPGNSGGPLVTETGEVLGVNMAKLTGEAVANVGFAAPSNEAKKLLTGKGIAFTTGGGANKLDGPALVKRVSPAVALITVTLGQQADGDEYHLSCTGHLFDRKVAKGGVMIIPGPPNFANIGAGTQIDVDSVGHVLKVQGGNQMPFLLGDLGMFLVEPLPADNRPAWESNGVCTITESSGGAFGVPRMPRMPRGPRFGPQPPQGPAGQTNSYQAKERTSYTRGAVAADTATISKRYEMKAEGKFTLVGDGQIVFDLKNGRPRTSELKLKLTATKGNTTTTLPITVTFKLVEGADRDKVLNPPPPPKVEPKPLTDDDLTDILADLKDANGNKRWPAANRLAQAKVTPARQAEVAKALEAALEIKDHFTRTHSLKALAVWGSKDNVPAILKLIDDSDVFVRRGAIDVLGTFADVRAAEPVAKRLVDFGDRGNVSKTLIAIGPAAEKAVLPYLQNADWGIRMEACKILGAIGTKQSKTALQPLTRDSNGHVAMEAKKAVAAVAARP